MPPSIESLAATIADAVNTLASVHVTLKEVAEIAAARFNAQPAYWQQSELGEEAWRQIAALHKVVTAVEEATADLDAVSL